MKSQIQIGKRLSLRSSDWLFEREFSESEKRKIDAIFLVFALTFSSFVGDATNLLFSQFSVSLTTEDSVDSFILAATFIQWFCAAAPPHLPPCVEILRAVRSKPCASQTEAPHKSLKSLSF